MSINKSDIYASCHKKEFAPLCAFDSASIQKDSSSAPLFRPKVVLSL